MYEEKKLAIVGSREFIDWSLLVQETRKFIDELDFKITHIVSGGARGADAMGKKFARNHRLRYEEYSADWEKYGNSAGMIRNKEIVDNSDAVILFWDGKSSGTKNTLETVMARGLPHVLVIYEKSDIDEWEDED